MKTGGGLKLFHQFILRALLREKLRSGITVLGISLGIAVIVAIRFANASALESFRTASEAIAGETSLQIAAPAGRFDELIVRNLDWLRDYGQASPMITGYAATDASDPSEAEFLQVLGIDALRDRAMRHYYLLRVNASGSEPSARELLRLLVDPKAIVLTEKFAGLHNIVIGQTLALVIGDTRQEFNVRGLLIDEGPARALDGRIAVMDIAAAQLAFKCLGQIDRLDLKLKRGIGLEQAKAEIARRLPAGLMAVAPQSRYGQVEKLIAAFHLNLTALGSCALLVGLFLVYNTVSISVITRRAEIGMLRAVGVSRRAVLGLFLGEAVLLACLGAVTGIVCGQVLAGAAIRATAATVETFYVASAATAAVSRQALRPQDMLAAFAVALVLSLIAAAIPALEAARVRPIEAIRGAERLALSLTAGRRSVLVAAALAAVGCVFTRVGPIAGLPIFGYAAAATFMFGGAFLAPAALWLACRGVGRLSARVLRGYRAETKLAGANLGAAIPRVSISVAALAVSLALMVAISVMIGSFRETVAYWVNQSLVADIYMHPLAQSNTLEEGRVSDDAIALVQADSDVAAVYPFLTRDSVFRDDAITVAAGDFNIFLKYGSLFFKFPRNAREEMSKTIGQDVVSVNESFSLRYKKDVGDAIELPTADGPREFKIVSVYYDYSSSRGWVVMDKTAYERCFRDKAPNSLSLYLRAGADPDTVKERLARSLGAAHRFVYITNAALRREVMRIFDSTFAITYALELIAILVAGLGVISTLITLILERRSEIALLSFIGANRAQIRRMIVIEAVLIGGVGQILGITIGLILSLVLIYVINVQSFGWTIQFHLPYGFFVQSTLLLLVATGAAGLYPAARAVKMEPAQVAREE